MSELPEGWIETELGSICRIEMGQSPPSNTYNIDSIGLPFFQGKSEFGDLYPTASKWCRSPLKIGDKDSILISVRAPVGPTNIASEKCCIGRGLAAIHTKGGIPPRYILYGIRASVHALKEKATGTTFEAISKQTLNAHVIPLAPLPEQHRIVEEIEKHFSRLDAAVEALKRAQQNLKRYRAAVLKAACEGKLVQTEAERAKEEGREYEPASVLLERILKERRRKWEEVELAKMKAKGVKPKDDSWKKKYTEPSPPDTNDLPDLPEGWVWATVEQLAKDEKYSLAIGPFGSNLKVSDYTTDGVPLIFVKNIRSGMFNSNDAKYVSNKKAAQLLPHRVRGGDILITKMGEPPGEAMLYPSNSPEAIITADCIKFRVSSRIVSHVYIVNCINSDIVRNQIALITKGVAQQKVSLARFIKICIPLPPNSEQERISNNLELRLSIAKETDIVLHTNLARAERLRQSILKRAFEGKLVKQNPDDEPASELLKRMRNEKVSDPTKNAKIDRKSNIRIRKMEKRSLFDVLLQAPDGLTPNELLEQSGHSVDTIEEFYAELYLETKKGKVTEIRGDGYTVIMKANEK